MLWIWVKVLQMLVAVLQEEVVERLLPGFPALVGYAQTAKSESSLRSQ